MAVYKIFQEFRGKYIVMSILSHRQSACMEDNIRMDVRDIGLEGVD
jgi:hypothetical protein